MWIFFQCRIEKLLPKMILLMRLFLTMTYRTKHVDSAIGANFKELDFLFQFTLYKSFQWKVRDHTTIWNKVVHFNIASSLYHDLLETKNYHIIKYRKRNIEEKVLLSNMPLLLRVVLTLQYCTKSMLTVPLMPHSKDL